MSDILSQSEIDKLLVELENENESVDVDKFSSAANEKKIKEYDFRRPSKFAKDHLRTLNIIHETFARYVTNYLSGILRTVVRFEVISVEEISYYEFSTSLSNPTVLAMVDFLPLSGFVLFEVKSNIAFSIIDRILGGNGSEINISRNFTDIEVSILEKTLSQITELLIEPWENVLEIKPKLDRIETNPQFAELLSPNEMAAMITFDTNIGDTRGLINLCIPHFVVESVMHKLSTKYWFATVEKEVPEEAKKSIYYQINNTNVPLKVLLGKTKINVKEFFELQKGDVIQLDTSIHSDLDVLVGDLVKFKGKPGKKNKHTAVKINKVINSQEDY